MDGIYEGGKIHMNVIFKDAKWYIFFFSLNCLKFLFCLLYFIIKKQNNKRVVHMKTGHSNDLLFEKDWEEVYLIQPPLV